VTDAQAAMQELRDHRHDEAQHRPRGMVIAAPWTDSRRNPPRLQPHADRARICRRA
jgi:hypothetical protein